MKIHDLLRILKRLNGETQIEINDAPIVRIERKFSDKHEMIIVLRSK